MSSVQRKQRKVVSEKIEVTGISSYEANKRILLFLIENLLPFETIKSPCFHKLVPELKVPEVETLVLLANELYKDFQAYFKQYVKQQEVVSLTCHSCTLVDWNDPYMFISAHFVDSKYRLCEIPVGMMSYNQSNLSNLVVRNVVMNDFKNKLKLITTNHRFDSKCREIFQFVMGDLDVGEEMIFPCIPSYLNSLVLGLFEELMATFSFTHKLDVNLNQARSSLHIIPQISNKFLGPIYDKFSHLEVKKLAIIESDRNGVCHSILCQESNDRSLTLRYLHSCLMYKQQIDSTGSITQFEWLLVEFVVEFNRIVYGIVLHSNSTQHPTMHLALKWINVVIVKLNEFCQSINGGIEAKIKAPVQRFISLINEFHSQLENSFEVTMASYLHPSTKRYLKESHVNEIATKVNGMSSRDLNEGDLDSRILRTFNCLGNSTECYHYESTAGADMGYSNCAYLTKEYGPDLLEFWLSHHEQLPVLGQISRQTLGGQVCSDRNYELFKERLPHLSISSCPLHVVFYLHRLVMQYDIQSFDERNLELDIEDYRV